MTRQFPVGLVGRMELLRSGRRFSQRRLALAVTVLQVLAVALAVGWFAATTAADWFPIERPIPTVVRGRIGAASLLATLAVASRTARVTGSGDWIPLGMTVTTPTVIVWGLAFADLCRAVILATPIAAAAVVGLAIGSAPMDAAVGMTLTVVAVGIAALGIGTALGYVGLLASRAGVPPRQYRIALSIGGIAAGVVIAWTWSIDAIVRIVGATPAGWFADALAAYPVTVDSAAALGRPGALVLGGVLCLLAAPRIAAVAWMLEGTDPRRHIGSSGWLTALHPPFLSTTARAVSVKTLRRTVRDPTRAVYLVFPIGIFAGMFGLPEAAAPIRFALLYLPLYGAWAAGAGFALNPLGDEGAALPVSLLTMDDAGRVTRGYVWPGIATVSLPLGAIVLALATVAGLAIEYTVTLLALVVPLLVASVTIAAACGVTFPRFSTVRIAESTEVVTPSKHAFLAHGAALIAVSLPGLSVPGAALTGLELSLRQLATIVAAQTLVSAVVAIGCLAYTTRRIERYFLE